MYDPKTCCYIIVACFILHNICVQNNLPLEDEEDEDENDDNENNGQMAIPQANGAGMQVRRQLINARFADIVRN